MGRGRITNLVIISFQFEKLGKVGLAEKFSLMKKKERKKERKKKRKKKRKNEEGRREKKKEGKKNLQSSKITRR